MTRINYGLPYMGSKNMIAKYIVDKLPAGKRLVELFCGGCAISHCSILQGKYSEYLLNDIDPRPAKTFVKALNGGFKNETRWISREDFFKLKDEDDYVRLCFSFGNRGNTYMYNTQLEPYKKAIHMAVVFNDWGEVHALMPEVAEYCEQECKHLETSMDRRKRFNYAIAEALKKTGRPELIDSNPLYKAITKKGSHHPTLVSLNSLQSLESLERLKSLQSLERLERLKSLKSLQSLESPAIELTAKAYDEYEYRDGDVVYCDPPYEGQAPYPHAPGFDSSSFWAWVHTRPYPVYVSESNAPEDFVKIWSKERPTVLSRNGSTGKREEALFIHGRWV